MAAKNIVVLFDESGTPGISNDERTDRFLGVGVAYDQSDEEIIFSECKKPFGLAKTKPLKNDQITNDHAVTIANHLADLPVSISVSIVNTADPTFRNMIVEYECFTKKARESRQVRKRPIAQIIHSQVLDHCLFHLITGLFEAGEGDAAFAIFIDNWSIPKDDVDTCLEYRAKLLRRNISPLCAKYHKGQPVSIAPLELLNKDTHRKRFVDVVASIFSRAYLRADNPKYSCKAVDILQDCGKAHCCDATQYSIEIMHNSMNDFERSSNQRL